MLKIISVPDKRLRLKSKPVAKIDKKVLKFIDQLNHALINKSDPPGIGLSAVQVTKPWRIFSTFLPKENVDSREDLSQKDQQIATYINPQIIASSRRLSLGGAKKDPFLEGCLSIPSIYGPVKRHQWIKLKWQLITGDWHQTKYSGFTARVIQHEVDHLNGILFTDRTIADKLPIYKEHKDKLQQIELT